MHWPVGWRLNQKPFISHSCRQCFTEPGGSGARNYIFVCLMEISFWIDFLGFGLCTRINPEFWKLHHGNLLQEIACLIEEEYHTLPERKINAYWVLLLELPFLLLCKKQKLHLCCRQIHCDVHKHVHYPIEILGVGVWKIYVPKGLSFLFSCFWAFCHSFTSIF